MKKKFMEGDASICGVDDAAIRREKAKARQLRKTRWWLQKISSGRCYYCGTLVSPSELTMDHVLPLARGGRSVKSNIVACCKACNNKKESMHFFEWQDYLQTLAR